MAQSGGPSLGFSANSETGDIPAFGSSQPGCWCPKSLRGKGGLPTGFKPLLIKGCPKRAETVQKRQESEVSGGPGRTVPARLNQHFLLKTVRKARSSWRKQHRPTVKREVGSREPTRRRTAWSQQNGRNRENKAGIKREIREKGENVTVLSGLKGPGDFYALHT